MHAVARTTVPTDVLNMPRHTDADTKGSEPNDDVMDSNDGARAAEDIVLELQGPSGDKVVGRLAPSHLSDHPHATEVLAGAIRVGSVLPEVLVLECRVRGGFVTVTRKPALLRAAQDPRLRSGLPKDIADVAAGMHVTGFVSNVTETACFVRFLNHLTGVAGRTHVSDAFVERVGDVMEEGQTVHAVVRDVDVARGKLSLSLKPSAVPAASERMIDSLYKCVSSTLRARWLTPAAVCQVYIAPLGRTEWNPCALLQA